MLVVGKTKPVLLECKMGGASMTEGSSLGNTDMADVEGQEGGEGTTKERCK